MTRDQEVKTRKLRFRWTPFPGLVSRNGQHRDYVIGASLAGKRRSASLLNIAEEREHHEPNIKTYRACIGGVARQRPCCSVRSNDLHRHPRHSRWFYERQQHGKSWYGNDDSAEFVHVQRAIWRDKHTINQQLWDI